MCDVDAHGTGGPIRVLLVGKYGKCATLPRFSFSRYQYIATTTWHNPRMLPRSSLKSCDGQLAQWSNGQVWKKQARDEMAPTHNSIQWPAMLGTWDKKWHQITNRCNRVVTWQPLTSIDYIPKSCEFHWIQLELFPQDRTVPKERSPIRQRAACL